jgi:hypothetical protein
LIEISIAKFDHFPFNYTGIEIDLEINRGKSVPNQKLAVEIFIADSYAAANNCLKKDQQ